MNEVLIKSVRKYVKGLFIDRHDEKSTYHSYNHTQDVAEAVEIIGRGNNLNDEDLEAVILAAWLHDTGYLFKSFEHEKESVRVAEEFLKTENYPEEKIKKVSGCILATQMNHKPTSLLEEIIQDADFSNLGSENNFRQSKLLRAEFANQGLKTSKDEDWFNEELAFLQKHEFNTPFARKRFEEQKSKNINKFKKKLKKYRERMELNSAVVPVHEENKKLENKILKEELELQKKIEKKENLSIRGFESIFRLTSSNYMRLNAMADNKAGLMLSLNGIIISFSLSVLAPKFDNHPEFIIPTCILVTFNLIAIVFATLSTRPKVISRKFSPEDIENKKVNLLFFGNFARLSIEDFEAAFKKMIRDRDYLHGSMIQDFYSLGKVLFKKFRYLRICYNIFMYGIVISVLAYTIAIAFKEQLGFIIP